MDGNSGSGLEDSQSTQGSDSWLESSWETTLLCGENVLCLIRPEKRISWKGKHGLQSKDPLAHSQVVSWSANSPHDIRPKGCLMPATSFDTLALTSCEALETVCSAQEHRHCDLGPSLASTLKLDSATLASKQSGWCRSICLIQRLAWSEEQ